MGTEKTRDTINDKEQLFICENSEMCNLTVDRCCHKEAHAITDWCGARCPRDCGIRGSKCIPYIENTLEETVKALEKVVDTRISKLVDKCEDTNIKRFSHNNRPIGF